MQNIKPLAKTIALRWRWLYDKNLNVPAIVGRDDSSEGFKHQVTETGTKITSFVHAPGKGEAMHEGYISFIKYLLKIIEALRKELLKKKGDNDND